MTQEERKSRYKEICSTNHIRSLFMQPWWLEACGEWNVCFAYRNNRITGAMPYSMKRRWGIRQVTMPPFTHHTGIWMDRPPDISAHKWLTREKQIIWSLVDDLPRYGFFSMVFSPDSFDNWLPFYWKGFRQEVRYTFVIRQNEYDPSGQHYNRNIKRNLREAEGIHVKTDPDAHAFFTMCTHTYKRQDIPMPYSFESFQKLDEAITLHQAGVKLGAYTGDNKLLAVAYLLWDGGTAYYFLAGDTDDGRSSGAGILICREAIRIAFEEKNVSTFDFCGSMLETVTEMRRQFGAASVPLMKIFRANHKWLDIFYALTR